VIVDVQRGLEDLPGGGEVRRRLLDTSLQKLREVASEYIEQVIMDRATMTALMEMGDVIVEFGVARQSDRSLADGPMEVEMSAVDQSAVELAEQFYNRANEIAAALHSSDPGDAQSQLDLAASLNRLGDVHLKLGDTNAAVAF
jgi:hypothetical protein